MVTAPDEVKIARYAARVCADRRQTGQAIEADAAIASRTRFPTRKRPPRPIMFLITQAICRACAPRWVALARLQGPEQQIPAKLVFKIREAAAPVRGTCPAPP